MLLLHPIFIFFFFNDTATTEIYTLSLHDALPISERPLRRPVERKVVHVQLEAAVALETDERSEEHTSELQSQSNLVCRLLLEKKKKKKRKAHTVTSKLPDSHTQTLISPHAATTPR